MNVTSCAALAAAAAAAVAEAVATDTACPRSLLRCGVALRMAGADLITPAALPLLLLSALRLPARGAVGRPTRGVSHATYLAWLKSMAGDDADAVEPESRPCSPRRYCNSTQWLGA